MRKAIMKKNKSYKFGKALSKDEPVFIKEEFAGKGRIVYTAFRKENDTLGYGVTASEFTFTEEETFIVYVERISYSSKNIEVRAKDRKEAERLAIEQAGNLEFSEHDAEYKASNVLSKSEHKKVFGVNSEKGE